MVSYKKPFDRTLYKLADSKAKTVMSSWLIQQGHEITDTKENYNCDLASVKDGKQYNSEVEIKYSWKGIWPSTWDEIRIPFRKSRLLSIDNLTFYVLRSDCQQAWAINSDILKTVATVKEVRNKFVQEGEEFFHIPVELAMLLDLNAGSPVFST